MPELQLVISILEHPKLKKFLTTERRAETACIVKIGTSVAGEIWRDAEQKWHWCCRDAENVVTADPLPFDRRIEAALALVQYGYKEEADRDVLNYESKGLKIALHGSQFHCTSCGEWVVGSAVGLRRIRPDLIRSQAQCARCRSKRV